MYHFFQQIFTQIVVIDVPSKSLSLQGILNFCMEEYKIKALGFRSVSRKAFKKINWLWQCRDRKEALSV